MANKPTIVLYIEWQDGQEEEFFIQQLNYRFNPFGNKIMCNKYFADYGGYMLDNYFTDVKKIELYFATKGIKRVFYNDGHVSVEDLKCFYGFSYVL